MNGKTEKIARTTVKTMGNGNQFMTGDFQPQDAWLSDTDYAKALDSVVITCVDIIILCNSGMVLGKRIINPWPGYWIIGGRMIPGETFEEAASRNTKRELGLDIDPSRFSYFGTYNFIWAKRQQKPKGHGSQNVAITMLLKISEEEWKNIKFDRKEYSSVERFLPESIRKAKDDVHPAIRRYAEEVIARSPKGKI